MSYQNNDNDSDSNEKDNDNVEIPKHEAIKKQDSNSSPYKK